MSDEIQNKIKVLTFLKVNFSNAWHPEQIASRINLPLNEVQGIIDESVLNLWVDVETITRGGRFVKINYAGNKKLNQLTGNAEALPTQDNITNINITGENVNIGKDNKIKLNNQGSPKDHHISNWVKWSTIFTGLGILVVIVIFLVTQSQTSIENNHPQLSLELMLYEQPDNTTFTTLILSNTGSMSASNVIVTINPTHKILNYKRDYWVDDVEIVQGGDLSLKAEMTRMASCTKMVLSFTTDGMMKDTDYSVYVTSDNANSIIYQTSDAGKKILDPVTDRLEKDPCK